MGNTQEPQGPHPAEQTRAAQGLVPDPLTQLGCEDSGTQGLPRNSGLGTQRVVSSMEGWVFLSLSLC